MKKIVLKNSGRLDQVLALELSISRSQAEKIIAKGVLIDGKTVTKAGCKVKENQEVSYQEEVKPSIQETDVPFSIVYEDDYLMVVNKPRGIVTHPYNGHFDDTLANGLARYFSINYDDEFRSGIVHRLDKDTSGLLIVGKTNESKLALQKLIQERRVHRFYKALCVGFIPDKKFKVDAPIGRDPIDRKKMGVTNDGKDAVTHFLLEEQFENCALLDCSLETGRTHQIRVHLAFIHHPIIGDILYNQKKYIEADCGQLLQAYKIEFVHPFTGKLLSLEIPLDSYFSKCLELAKKGQLR